MISRCYTLTLTLSLKGEGKKMDGHYLIWQDLTNRAQAHTSWLPQTIVGANDYKSIQSFNLKLNT
jgi:hypothetical protein